jgi:hypothetical protein
MAGLVPAIHVLGCNKKKDVDGRDVAGHDEDRIIFRELEMA